MNATEIEEAVSVMAEFTCLKASGTKEATVKRLRAGGSVCAAKHERLGFH